MAPYLSEAQREWAHTPEGTKALGGKDKVAEWDKASEGKKLPKRIGATRKKKAMSMLVRGMEGHKR